MTWRTVDIRVLNESKFLFQPSQVNPRVLKGCTLEINDQSSSQGGWNIPPEFIDPRDEQSRLFELQGTGEDRSAALLTFDIGDLAHKLVIYIQMNPEQNSAGIRAAILEAEKEINSELLSSLTIEALASGKTGFEETALSAITASDGSRTTLGVATGLDIAMIDEGSTEYYSLLHPVVWIYIRDLAFQFPKSKPAGEGVSHFEIAGGWKHLTKNPIHENMSLAALILADIWATIPNRLTNPSVTWDTVADGWQNSSFNETQKRWLADQFEYIRGVVWNDDPACALFNDSQDRNNDYAYGIDWLLTFKKADWIRTITANAQKDKAENQIINRSHYGDLQFLHSMACKEREQPEATKRKIMIWLEVMYKLACHDRDWGIKPETSIKDTKLKEFFSDNSVPRASDTLRRLLLAKTQSYKYCVLERRALGSCFHTIQDSYAVGHCKRALTQRGESVVKIKKPSILDTFNTALDTALDTFRKSEISTKNSLEEKMKIITWMSPARFGGIQNFHCYDGQDEDKHGQFDTAADLHLEPKKLDSFKQLIGATDAIEKCAKLANYWCEKKPWDGEGGVQQWLDKEIFQLDHATDANTGVSFGD